MHVYMPGKSGRATCLNGHGMEIMTNTKEIRKNANDRLCFFSGLMLFLPTALPMVINTMAINMVVVCSMAKNLAEASFITPAMPMD